MTQLKFYRVRYTSKATHRVFETVVRAHNGGEAVERAQQQVGQVDLYKIWVATAYDRIAQ